MSRTGMGSSAGSGDDEPSAAAASCQPRHALIPDYEIEAAEPLVEHGWQLGLDALPLRWSAKRSN